LNRSTLLLPPVVPVTACSATTATLAAVEQQLEQSRLAREDTLCRDSMTQAERRGLRERRPAQAQHWNLLTSLVPGHLSYAS